MTSPNLTNFPTGKVLKFLHQNIRSVLANKDSICQILDSFRNFHVFSLSETHLSIDDEAEAQIEGYTDIGFERLLVRAKAEVSGFTFLHLSLSTFLFLFTAAKTPLVNHRIARAK